MAMHKIDANGPYNHFIKNKENESPSLSAGRRARSAIPSLIKSPDRSEFFTDSYLADRDASLIPSPSPAKVAAARTKRQHRPNRPTRASHTNGILSHRSDYSESHIPKRDSPPSVLERTPARGTSPIRTGLTTPPGSRDSPSIASPFGHLPSSPPPALVQNYERIDQEQDLAATEGEISDPDSASEDFLIPSLHPQQTNPDQRHPWRSHDRSQSVTLPQDLSRSRHVRIHDDNNTITSDPTGAIDFTDKSFLDNISDIGLAEKLTPFLSQSAKDRQRLREVWANHKPIAFGKTGKTRMESPILSRPTLVSPEPAEVKRIIPFSKAGRIKLESDFKSNSQAPSPSRQTDDPLRAVLPLNTRLQRSPYFKQNHGFPARTSHPLQQDLPDTPLLTRSHGAADADPDRGDNGPTPVSDNNQIREANLARLPLQRPLLHRTRSVNSESGFETSPEKSRRLDFDFTGQSFQVSESPPIRSRAQQDFEKEREIQGLAKQAVTTSRLNQIRARESSQERLRQSTRSPLADLTETTEDLLSEKGWTNGTGQPVPNTPVVIYKATPNGKPRDSFSAERPSTQRSTSCDVLHRLSRGSSSTPVALTPSNRASETIGDADRKQGADEPVSATKVPTPPPPETEAPTLPQKMPSTRGFKHDQTPRITGAWTDTILPETVRTLKQPARASLHTQTPFISAGGWVDTPMPGSVVERLETLAEEMLESQQSDNPPEIPAELMNGIAKDSASDTTLKPQFPQPESESVPSIQESKGLVTTVLDNARTKLHQQPGNSAHADDSLNLNNTTIQSLEDFLNADDTDLTILSKLGLVPPVDGDADTLDRLGSKLDRLSRNIHDARKGISKLEHQVSISGAEEKRELAESEMRTNRATQAIKTSGSPSATRFPLRLITLSFPIPVLWRARRPDLNQKLPRLTLIGWLVFATLTWYVIECTLSVLYSRPQYAETYIWPDQPEPEFPWVLPTLLWRWSCLDFVHLWVIEPILTAITGVYRILGMFTGWTDGFADTRAAAARMAQVPADAMYNVADMDMMNDEFL